MSDYSLFGDLVGVGILLFIALSIYAKKTNKSFKQIFYEIREVLKNDD